MSIFNFRNKSNSDMKIQTAVADGYKNDFSSFLKSSSSLCERSLYKSLKDNVPIIDAAVSKIIRLIGDFKVKTDSPVIDEQINGFLKNIRVNACETGIKNFISCYLQQLLIYGTAVGEIVPDSSCRNIAALYNASLDDIDISYNGSPINIKICSVAQNGDRIPVKYPSLILFSAIMPEPGQIYGTSVLKGLPFIADILLKIFNAVGTNWDRVGNVRFAVSYKPTENERSFSKDRARLIADEWSKAMKSSKPKDFITVGDVTIKAIGADNQIPDSNIPVRQLLEQITAKLSIPPFLLGLSWSSTERMSSQQADILTSELEYYRRVLDSTITRICDTYFKFNGIKTGFEIIWDNINLQDEVELAKARLFNAQALQIENKLERND